ncbi:DHA2 family efflux MFS transporter permease subunit [Micromonospora sp. WMMD736]|uniref:DHA2 family efflux MFS transporter permease subunit n=1 Tax=Micromonospora sp. WMMD736 TaxID=3404112 RepID=UPI003B948259
MFAASLPMFMVALDNLVVTNALNEIRNDLSASLTELGWVSNSYILAFAACLLAAAGLGDRFGRRRVFLIGIVAFTLTSIGAGLAGSAELLILFRTLQGVSAAAIMPLSLTLLATAVPPERRGAAIGLWAGVSSLAVAVAPLLGGAITTGLSWHWIFLINVPVGIVALPLALRGLNESERLPRRLDVLGILLAGVAVLALVWAVLSAPDRGWTSAAVLGAFVGAAVLLVVFVLWEKRAADPLLPLRFYRSRAFVLANVISWAVYFAMFGAVFLIAQFLQFAQGRSALAAGLWTLPWSIMPMLVAPKAGAIAGRIGGSRLVAIGLALCAAGVASFALVVSPDAAPGLFVVPFILAGTGMGLVFAPITTVVLSAVGPADFSTASGANTTVRELGGACGIAVLASVFAVNGGFGSAAAFTDGMVPGLWISVAVAAAGALVALAIPGPRPAPAPVQTAAKQESASA